MHQAGIAIALSLFLPCLKLAVRVQRAMEKNRVEGIDAAIDGLDEVILLVVPRNESMPLRNPAPTQIPAAAEFGLSGPYRSTGPQLPRALDKT